MNINMDQLYQAALAAADAAYVPYSHFRVGAALLGDDGTIYSGCNVENRSYGLTICAERSAVVQAVSKKCRSFKAIAVATPDSASPVGPCGACRQVLSEFMESSAPVRFKGSGTQYVDSSIGELYPYDSLHELAQNPDL